MYGGGRREGRRRWNGRIEWRQRRLGMRRSRCWCGWRSRWNSRWNWNFTIPGQHDWTSTPWRMMTPVARRRYASGCGEIILKSDDQSGVTSTARRAQWNGWNQIDQTRCWMGDSISWRQFFTSGTVTATAVTATTTTASAYSTTSSSAIVMMMMVTMGGFFISGRWFFPRQMRFDPRFQLATQHGSSFSILFFPSFLFYLMNWFRQGVSFVRSYRPQYFLLFFRISVSVGFFFILFNSFLVFVRRRLKKILRKKKKSKKIFNFSITASDFDSSSSKSLSPPPPPPSLYFLSLSLFYYIDFLVLSDRKKGRLSRMKDRIGKEEKIGSQPV